MALQNITGSWTGVITYGQAYGEDEGQDLYFEMEIKQEHSAITGIARDTGGYGASPDPATIAGSCDGEEIIFTKQYRTNHSLGNDRVYVDKSTPGPEIYYTGKYHAEINLYVGEWTFENDQYEYSALGSGIWTMKKKFAD